MVVLSKLGVKYFGSAGDFYVDLLRDIGFAKKSIVLESYRFGGGVGLSVISALEGAARRGVHVKLLLDHWGLMLSSSAFNSLFALGVEIRFFRVFKFTSNFFAYNNRRDHRKIVVIDDFISYVGSANINDHSRGWREFVVRFENFVLARKFYSVFLDTFKVYNFFFHSVKRHIAPIKFDSLEIVRDVPSLRFQKIRNKLLHLIRNAKREVIIETPYFVPDFKMLFALLGAARRGVVIKLIIPKKSDVKIVDVFVQSFFGKLHKMGVKIFLFRDGFTHAKLGLVDDVFFFGSSNFDYRSFRYQYEISLFGKNSVLFGFVRSHLDSSFLGCDEFDYDSWKSRPFHKRVLEVFLRPFRHLF